MMNQKLADEIRVALSSLKSQQHHLYARFERLLDFISESLTPLKKVVTIAVVESETKVSAFLVGLEKRYSASKERAEITGLSDSIIVLRGNRDVVVDLVEIAVNDQIVWVYFVPSDRGGPMILGLLCGKR
jgi:hypothetical protein